ncbi:unnamed protein product, partial [Ectocarpus fasciculatus]
MCRSAQATGGMNVQSQSFVPGQRWYPSTTNDGASHSHDASSQAHFHVETIQTGRGIIRRYTTRLLASENDPNSAAKMPARSSTHVAENGEEDSKATTPVIAAEVPITSDGNVVGVPDVADVAGVVEETKVEEGKTVVASATESCSSSTEGNGDGGRKWKGLHVGVWLAIGAGVAVGAALWSRRRSGHYTREAPIDDKGSSE